MSFKIKFINHACFQIIREDFSALVDPWFSGKVFNNSWKLLRETNIENLDLSNLKYIFISHEHRDHLSWSTLKQIREECQQEIEVITCSRNNENVGQNIEKLGFKYTQLPPFQYFQNEETPDFGFSFFKKNHDSAIVFEINEKIIFNKNDCEFSKEELQYFKDKIFNDSEIDYLFNQFSLAGYYANHDEKDKLEEAKQRHISDLIGARSVLKPKITIPFASFITFCREENSFLNDYIVSLRDDVIGTDELTQDIFVPYYIEEIPSVNDEGKSLANANKWKEIFDEQINSKKDESVQILNEEIGESFEKMQKEMRFLRDYNNYSLLEDTFFLHLTDTKYICEFNFSKKDILFHEYEENLKNKSCASVTSYDLNCFFKFPWGADTMNITSCFSVHDTNSWRKMLAFRDATYVR